MLREQTQCTVTHVNAFLHTDGLESQTSKQLTPQIRDSCCLSCCCRSHQAHIFSKAVHAASHAHTIVCALFLLSCRTFDIGAGRYNSFAMTRPAIDRFGLFDENTYPSFFEDNGFTIRQGRMKPPMQPTTLQGVVMHHGKPHESSYSSGMHTKDDPAHAGAESTYVLPGNKGSMSTATTWHASGAAHLDLGPAVHSRLPSTRHFLYGGSQDNAYVIYCCC